MYPLPDSNQYDRKSADFKSAVSTIPPRGLCSMLSKCIVKCNIYISMKISYKINHYAINPANIR